jgi:hypothetical protein
MEHLKHTYMLQNDSNKNLVDFYQNEKKSFYFRYVSSLEISLLFERCRVTHESPLS